MILEGKRVRLRPLERSDLPARLKMVNDPAVQRFSTGVRGDETSETDMYIWFDLYSEDPYSEQWAIVDHEGRFLGDMDLHSIGVMGNEAWLIPMFADESLWNDQSIRTEAMELILRYVFEQKGVDAVHIDVPSTDAVGIEILKALGFERTDAFELDVFNHVWQYTYSVTPEMLRTGGKAADRRRQGQTKRAGTDGDR